MTTYYRTRTGGRDRPLHTDEECSQLEHAGDVRAVEREWYPEAPICAYCSGDREQPTPDRSAYNAAMNGGDSA